MRKKEQCDGNDQNDLKRGNTVFVDALFVKLNGAVREHRAKHIFRDGTGDQQAEP